MRHYLARNADAFVSLTYSAPVSKLTWNRKVFTFKFSQKKIPAKNSSSTDLLQDKHTENSLCHNCTSKNSRVQGGNKSIAVKLLKNGKSNKGILTSFCKDPHGDNVNHCYLVEIFNGKTILFSFLL